MIMIWVGLSQFIFLFKMGLMVLNYFMFGWIESIYSFLLDKMGKEKVYDNGPRNNLWMKEDDLGRADGAIKEITESWKTTSLKWNLIKLSSLNHS